MNYKKIFFSVVMVALAATMSVGLTACKDDEIKIDKSRIIMGKWECALDCGGHRIEFNDNLTYSYGNPELGNGSGTYRILKTLENQEVRLGNRDGEPYMATLFIIAVSPNGVFDQLWAYYVPRVNHSSSTYKRALLAVDYYSNNQLLTDFLFPFYSDKDL